MSYRDEDRLDLILELIGHLDRRMTGMSRERFLGDRDEIDLAAYRLSMIGEACGRLPASIRERRAEIAWADVIAMRNVIAHDYNGIDAKLVWNTLGQDLRTLAAVCRKELAAISSDGDRP